MADPPLIVERTDPLIVFQFGLEIDGVLDGYFAEVSGIGNYHEVVEKQLVNKQGHSFVMKAPGILKDDDIVLKRGITADMQIWEWRAEAERGDLKSMRRNCSIVMFNRQFEEIARWDFVNAWPSKVSGPEPSSDGSEFGIEEVTLAHEGFMRVK